MHILEDLVDSLLYEAKQFTYFYGSGLPHIKQF